jgi:pimeloyl-ACP methyl ester carboxylesterase
MPKIQAGNVTLHYIASGRGPDLVMLHGFLGNLAVWHLNIVPELRDRFRVLTYDLRGHGYSQVTPDGYTTGHMVEDLRHLLAALGIERPHLVGHSFGADICLHFAMRYPEKVGGLVAVEPGLAALVGERKRADWAGWAYWVSKLEEVGLEVPPDKRCDIEYLLNLTLETPKIFGPARGLPRNRAPLLHLLRNTTLMRDYEEPGDLTREAVPSITTPTLLVYGEKSHFLGSFSFLSQQLPNCTSVLLPGGEHFGPLEQPDLLVGHIREFLQTGAARRTAREPAAGTAAERSASQGCVAGAGVD